MAHHLEKNDQMVYVGEVPWHGLGIQVPADITPLEALKVSKLDWEVKTIPLRLDGDGRFAISKYNRPSTSLRPARAKKETNAPKDPTAGAWKATVRSDTNEILGIVGPDYHVFQNTSLAKIFTPIVESGKATVETCGSLFNGRKVWMLARMAGKDEAIRQGDPIRRYLLLAHGHDGRLAVRFGLTPIRVVCWNTLSAAVFERKEKKDGEEGMTESKLIRMLHTASLESNLDTLAKALDVAEEMFMLSCEEFRTLAKRGVSKADLKEYARRFVKAPKNEEKQTGPQQKKMAQIVELALQGKGNTGNSWWDAYNGATEFLTWVKGRTAETRIDSVWLGDGVNEARRAYEIAAEMAT